MAARSRDTVYEGMVEDEDPDDERDNFNFIKNMEKKGPNEYVWGKLDLLYTSDNDLLCRVDPVVPVNNRTLALNQDQKYCPENGLFYFSIPHIALCSNFLCSKV